MTKYLESLKGDNKKVLTDVYNEEFCPMDKHIKHEQD